MNETVDVSGLSEESVRVVEDLVQSLRSREGEESWCLRDPEGWSKALREWVESHPKRDIVIDDSRETIYAGRGE
jgi:hypothetical protein